MANSASVSYIKVTHNFKFDFSQIEHLHAENFVSTPIFNAFGHDWVIDCYQGPLQKMPGFRISFLVRHYGEYNNVEPTFVCSLMKKGETASRLYPVLKRGGTICTFDQVLKRYWTKFLQFSVGKSPFQDQVFAYVGRDELQFKKDFVIDGSFELICSITNTDIPPNRCYLPVPQSFNLHSQIGKLLESDETADLIFDVQNGSFMCHRIVLAARSPVFKAELFGNMAEATLKRIKIEDMSPEVFEAMLHFIYTDSFPYCDSEKSSTIMAKHLFVASDRYEIDGLKALCEDELCTHISLDTVTTTLALAQQHNSPRLKNVCLEFIAEPGTLISWMLSDKYEDLVSSFPSIMAKIRDRVDTGPSFKIAKKKKTK